MRLLQAVLFVSIATSCATSTQPTQPDPRIEETRVFIETVKPEVVSYVRYQEPLRFDAISNMHVILRTEAGIYLLETERMCRSLTSQDIYIDMADRRSMRGRLRAGIDTLRGCTIGTIYRLPAEEAETTTDESGQTTTQEPK